MTQINEKTFHHNFVILKVFLVSEVILLTDDYGTRARFSLE
jgi:hypothetical protein